MFAFWWLGQVPEKQESVSYKPPLQMVRFVRLARGQGLNGASGQAWYQLLQFLLWPGLQHACASRHPQSCCIPTPLSEAEGSR